MLKNNLLPFRCFHVLNHFPPTAVAAVVATAGRMKSESSDESYLNGHSSGDMPNNHVNGNIPSLRSPSTSEEPLIPKADQAVKPIAIIGMSCRFPGDCTNPDELWNMISEGRSGWSSIPSDRFNQEAFYHPSSDMTGTVCLFTVFGASNADNASLAGYERWSFSERRPITL